MPYRDACRLFGFDIPAGKPSVPKRIKRDVARGKTSLIGELLETRELNQWDLLHTVMLADGKTTFEVATYNPGNRWPDAWTSGAALASPRGGAILTTSFSPSKSFQFGNEQLCWEQGSPQCHDCHSPPHAARVGFHDDRSPPRRLAVVARSDPWKTTPAQVGFPGDATRRRRLPWVVGSDLWNNSSGGDYLPSASTAAIHWFPPIW